MKLGFLDVGYLRSKNVPSRYWPISNISILKVIASPGMVSFLVYETTSLDMVMRRSIDPLSWLEEIIDELDLVITYNGLEGDYPAIAMITPKVIPTLLTKSVDVMAILTEQRDRAIPHKRGSGGLKLVDLYQQSKGRGYCPDLFEKHAGQHPIYDCHRLYSVWRMMLEDSKFLYHHRDSMAVIDLDQECRSQLRGKGSRIPEEDWQNLRRVRYDLYDPLASNSLPDWVDEIMNDVERSDRRSVLMQSLQLLGPHANDRIRERLLQGKRPLKADLQALEKAIVKARYPEIINLAAQRYAKQMPALLAIKVHRLYDRYETGGADIDTVVDEYHRLFSQEWLGK